MFYSTSFAVVDGIWREVLIIESANPITFEGREIKQELTPDTDRVFYHDGLYQHIEEDGKHYYWFVVQAKEIILRADRERLAALETLMADMLIKDLTAEGAIV